MPSSTLPAGRAALLLALLTLGFLLNSFDRSVVAVLLEPIGREFDASDTQLGLLSGLAFAVVYSISGLPIAAWADRGRPGVVLALGIIVWSLATAACGLAASFGWLLLARMGTAAGEAAGTPASHTLIATLFPADRRATALAVYAIGGPAGAALAGVLGGWGADTVGWRMTLVLAALPGLVLASALLLALPHERSPRTGAPATARLSWRETVQALWPNRAWRGLWLGSALHCMALFSAVSFNPAFLMRSHGWEASTAGVMIGLLGVAGAIGTFAGGWCADSLVRRTGDTRWTLRFAGLVTLASAPFQVIAYLAEAPLVTILTLPLAGLLGNAYLGPAYAAAQGFAPAAARTRSTAVLMLAMTLVGMGLGPLLTGFASDAMEAAAGARSLGYALLAAPALNVAAAAVFLAAAGRR